MTNNLISRPPKAAIVSFTDPRQTDFISEREAYIRTEHEMLRKYLKGSGVDIVDPMDELRGLEGGIFGLASTSEIKRAAEIINRNKAECLVFGLWHWTEPELPLRLARLCNLPIALYTTDDPMWAGTVCISAVGASLWEIRKPFFTGHFRVRGDKAPLVPWIKAQSAVSRLMQGTLLMWGGSYCLRMEHLRDDASLMKSDFIGDILTEDQYMLIRRAEDILLNRPDRLASFSAWAEHEGMTAEYDGRMLTPQVHERQIALHLAAVDRLAELRDEDIIGVSIKCQHELSVEYGVTACLLPGFLPFGLGPEGERNAVATVCEGDTKGLYTCAALHALNPKISPLFGDLKYFNDEMILISNCGASSLEWAAHPTEDSRGALSGVTYKPQCQGASGGALGYAGRPGEVTVARLVRIAGDYFMQLGVGEVVSMDKNIWKKILWGQMWPHIPISMGGDFDASLFVQAVGSNHLSATYGDVSGEVEHLCRRLDIPVVHIDDADEMLGFVEGCKQ